MNSSGCGVNSSVNGGLLLLKSSSGQFAARQQQQQQPQQQNSREGAAAELSHHHHQNQHNNHHPTTSSVGMRNEGPTMTTTVWSSSSSMSIEDGDTSSMGTNSNRVCTNNNNNNNKMNSSNNNNNNNNRVLPPPSSDLDVVMIAEAKNNEPLLAAAIDTSSASSQQMTTKAAFRDAVLTAISELERFQNGGSGSGGGTPSKNAISIQDTRYLELTKDKPVKLQVRVLVPVMDHPKFNFVGKLLGPKGNSLKRLQEDTLTKMAILGRGSMRDKAKETELRMTNDPKFAHLNEDLHVEISTFAPPAEAYARVSHALSEIKRFLVPDYNDDIRQGQLRELAFINGKVVPAPPPPPPPPRRPGAPPPPPLVAAAGRSSRVGLLATPPARAIAARTGVVPHPSGRAAILRAAQVSRGAAYRAAVADSRLGAEDEYVYDDGYPYPADTYDESDAYYEYSAGAVAAAAAVDPYPEEYAAELTGEDWRIGTSSSRLKAPRAAMSRSTFRDHPYAPPAPPPPPPPPPPGTSTSAVTTRF